MRNSKSHFLADYKVQHRCDLLSLAQPSCSQSAPSSTPKPRNTMPLIILKREKNKCKTKQKVKHELKG
jgi:hypothetical protein